jgi:hypothetical protein
VYHQHAQLLPGRPARLVASAPHSSGLLAASALRSEYRTRSEKGRKKMIKYPTFSTRFLPLKAKFNQIFNILVR